MVTIETIVVPEAIDASEFSANAAKVGFAQGNPLISGYSWVLYGSKVNTENIDEWKSAQEVNNSSFNFDVKDKYNLDGYVLQG